ncbi:MAG: hypothetical protein ACKVP5_04055 [Aestuariivirga sp.]
MPEPAKMDWPKAIERNRDALLRIVATLFAMLGFSDTASIERLPRALRNAILRILRPAEAAVRRLIVVAARGMALKPSAHRPMPKGKQIVKKGTGKARCPLFRLEDIRPPMVPGPPRKKYRKSIGIHFYPYTTLIGPGAVKPAPLNDGKVDGAHLMRRLQAARNALENLAREAQRYLRWKAKREKIYETRLIYTNPIRPGPPPYVHKKPGHEVEAVLRECHWLAWEARGLDSS